MKRRQCHASSWRQDCVLSHRLCRLPHPHGAVDVQDDAHGEHDPLHFRRHLASCGERPEGRGDSAALRISREVHRVLHVLPRRPLLHHGSSASSSSVLAGFNKKELPHRLYVQQLFLFSALPSFPGTVRSYGDGGFGEGLHIVLHVERGIDEAHTERGRDAAAFRKGEREIVGLDVQEVRLERGREGFGEVRDAFRRGIIEEDEAAVFGGGAEDAEEGGGFSLECGRKILQQAEERGVLLCRAECFVAACSLLACHLIRLCGKREPEERAVCGKLPRDLLPEGEGFGRLAVLVE